MSTTETILTVMGSIGAASAVLLAGFVSAKLAVEIYYAWTKFVDEGDELLPVWAEILPLFIVRYMAKNREQLEVFQSESNTPRTTKSHVRMVYVRPSLFISDEHSTIIVHDETRHVVDNNFPKSRARKAEIVCED